jgi:hypothetical protein
LRADLFFAEFFERTIYTKARIVYEHIYVAALLEDRFGCAAHVFWIGNVQLDGPYVLRRRSAREFSDSSKYSVSGLSCA